MKGSRLSEDWRPDPEQMEWARRRRPDLDIEEQLEMFRNYWCDKTGKDATKIAWKRTFANWIIRSYGPIKKPEVSGAKPVWKREPRQKPTGRPQQLDAILKFLGMAKT